tara:strand:- start:1417 stop:1830 length:414 start_codon:yes stop_codon:yes gene_type:complete
VLLFAGLLAGCWQSNAGGLTGRPTDTPASFHFLGRSAPCHIELPGVPRSVRVNCFHVDGALHIHSNRFAHVPRLRGESWVNVVRRDPDVRVEINGRIYALTAIPIADESQRQALLLARGYWRAWDGITIFRFAKSSG